MQYRYLLFLLNFNLIDILSTKFIYQHLYGSTIRNAYLNFSIFIRDFHGIIFYSASYDGRFLMKFTVEKTILVQINDAKIFVNISELCGCNKCMVKYLTFIVDLSAHNMSIKCNNQSIVTNNIATNILYKNELPEMPIPKSILNNKTKEMFIWMGNIGPFIGYNNKSYYPIKEQLFGCVDHFYFNNKLIQLQNNSKYFLSFCYKKFNENICNASNCTNKITLLNVFNCALPVLNKEYCNKELSNFPGQKLLFDGTKNNNKPIKLIFIWSQRLSRKHCLMEIKLRNGSLIIFFTNLSNDVIMNIRNNNSNKDTTKILNKISINITNILLIKFDNSDIIIKTYNNYTINTFIYRFTSEPDQINIPYSNIYEQYDGKYDLLFDTKQWQTNNVVKTTSKKNNNTTKKVTIKNPTKENYQKIYIPVIIAIFGFLLILGGIYGTIKKYIKSKNEKSDPKRVVHRNKIINVKHISVITSPYHDSCEYSVISLTDSNYQ